MAEKYGIKAKVLEAVASTPVSSTSCVVYLGYARGSKIGYGTAKYFNNFNDYVKFYHSGNEPKLRGSLDDAAEYALSIIDGAWFVNCNQTAADSYALETAADYNVIEDALAAICLNSSDVPNIICIPMIQDSTVLSKLVSQCKGGINGTFYAQGFIDCEQSADQLDDTGSPDATKITAPNTDGCLIAAWGNVILDMYETEIIRHIPASIVLSAARAEQDAKNVNGVPYRSIGNLRVSMKGVTCVESNLQKCTCRENQMNAVVENGIVSFVNKGNNRWYTWGDHTAAVSAGSATDETYRFDSTVAVLYHILNRFVQKWGTIIDSPMSLRLRDCILSEEQDYLNGLKALGCIVGNPKCEFRALDNSADTLGQGQFYFTNIATIVPPAKYIELGLQYTDAGLTAYLEG